MAAYYNELDPKAAAWLRELIKGGHIADGEVDERSIVDVQPDDVRGFSQCHWFAGIGGWSLALRLADWPDDRPVWTGSCPCQPFSSAGKGIGGDDPRHLWPAWFRLIRECRPDVVFGEQVESAIGHGWLDLVFDDLEAEGYACGPVGLPGPCVGAFDIRQRLWFVADTERWATERHGQSLDGTSRGAQGAAHERQRVRADARDGGDAGALADAEHTERWPISLAREDERDGPHDGRTEAHGQSGARRPVHQLADAACERPEDAMHQRGNVPAPARSRPTGHVRGAGASFWTDAEWLACTDGKARPVEPGTFPLAYGVPNRVVKLRGYGNAIKAEVAAEVIAAYMEIA